MSQPDGCWREDLGIPETLVVPGPEPKTPEEILAAAMAELAYRLEHRPKDIATPTLARLLDSATKAAERTRDRERERAGAAGESDPLGVILASGLSEAKQRQLIEKEIAKHEATIARYRRALEGDDDERQRSVVVSGGQADPERPVQLQESG